MTGKGGAVESGDGGVNESELSGRCGNLLDQRVGVSPRIARVRNEAIERPEVDMARHCHKQ